MADVSVSTGSLSTPHGGVLVDRLAPADEAERWREKIARAPVVRLGARAIADLECIASGAYSPLEGFMTRADYDGVVADMRLANGLPWSLPVVLPVHDEATGHGVIALADRHGHPIAVLEVEDVWRPNREREARLVYGTDDGDHPGVKATLNGTDTYAGGRITLLEPIQHAQFDEYRLTPRQTRHAFQQHGWRTVVGFQTRNPVHRAHEYLQKVALEMVDGLLLHPLVGETKDDDVPADVRMRCYEVLLDDYYPAGRVQLSVFPAAMRYAGPREAIVHALARKNYGCTHFIVGRDHAGVGNYYGTFDAQKIFDDNFTKEEIGIEILKFEHSFFCTKCEGMATTKTCPHDAEHRVALSGSKVREMLVAGQAPPPEFSRPEVAKILIDGYRKES